MQCAMSRSHGRVKICWLVQLRQSGTLWYLGISRQCPCEMQRELMRIAHVVILLHVLIGAGCWRQPPASGNGSTKQIVAAPAQRIEVQHLPNAYRLHDRVISGGLPEGEAAFKELQALGIRTVISVDGAKPDVELARKFGMRYVHLPHGYDGIPKERAKELAKAVRDLDGPIYIH